MANKQKEKETVKNGKKNAQLSTQRYLQFAEAHDDTLVLKSGGLRAVLEVSSVNFNLKSTEEQDAIISSYQQFLNALNFPTQILIKSRKLDIDHYLTMLGQRQKEVESPLLKKQMEEYSLFIQRLVENADIMEKKFYVVVPMNPMRAEPKGVFAKFLSYVKPDDTVVEILRRKREFASYKKDLDTRVNVVTTALENCNLRVKRLNTEQIIEILYQSYNPQLARAQKFTHIEDLSVQTDPTELVNEPVSN